MPCMCRLRVLASYERCPIDSTRTPHTTQRARRTTRDGIPGHCSPSGTGPVENAHEEAVDALNPKP
jgi:hypothetical protein